MTVVVQDLIDLAERCEATGPDREVDLAIINAISTKAGWFWNDADHRIITRNDYGHGAIGNPICSLENFTGSIDAAMTLVPEGCDFYFEVEQVMGGFCNYLYVTGGGSIALSHDLRGKGGRLHKTWKEAVEALPREISGTALRARASIKGTG